MSLTQLNAVSPIDGRYRGKVADLAKYFSEEALICLLYTSDAADD